MTITWTTFAIRLMVGFLLAVGIGIERQWLKTREVLKINVLVTLGSAMFVMLAIMTPGDSSPTRIAAQIVSGVGFLGGGVILREGASVKGINTAATLWCAAAVGTLVGSGFLVQAYLATLIVVGSNLLLRPLVGAFKHQKSSNKSVASNNNVRQSINNSLTFSEKQENLATNKFSIEKYNHKKIQYDCNFICSIERELDALEIVINFAKEKELLILSMQSSNINSKIEPDKIEAKTEVRFQDRSSSGESKYPQNLIKLLRIEAEASSISWQVISIDEQ